MDIQKIDAARLNPAPYNPRRDLKPGDKDYEKLKRSMEQFGIVEPVVWNQQTGNVVGGHQRLKILLDMGETLIDCVVVDLDPPREKALNLALNRITGDWDEGKLAALMADLDASAFDVSLTGFDAEEIDALMNKFYSAEAVQDNFNQEEAAADIAAEIENPLPFAIEPNSPDPQVLVMHTHATEDYRLSAGLWFAPGDGARSTDCSVNMCAVGRVVADTLNAAGINTLHDETLNDYPSYTGSYANSRAVVQQYLARYPSIKVVLDVHRDAIETESGSRYAPVCTVDGRQAAQVMIICGCDNGTTVQLPGWRQNLRFAAAWERSMEGMYPGFTRPVLFSYRFYNQDLTTGSLLIEIGGHGNNLNEALYAGQLAAKGLAAALLGGA